MGADSAASLILLPSARQTLTVQLVKDALSIPVMVMCVCLPRTTPASIPPADSSGLNHFLSFKDRKTAYFEG